MKKRNDYWFPLTRPKQLVMFTNVEDKIEGYETILPFAKAKIDRILLICQIFIAVYNFVEQTRARSKNLTDFQDLIFTAEGGIQGEPAPAPPVFQVLTLPGGAFVGIFEEFKELIAELKLTPNYTRGIGEDLMVVGTKGEDLVLDNVVFGMHAEAVANTNRVKISGSMQGLSAAKVEYHPKGGGAVQSFFLTKLPAEIKVKLATAGQPESGIVRGFLFEDNEEVGQPSPDFNVTVT